MAFSFYPIVDDHSARSRRSEPQLSLFRMAAVLAPRSSVRHAGPGLEHDDVDVRRLVFRGRFGSHLRRRPQSHCPASAPMSRGRSRSGTSQPSAGRSLAMTVTIFIYDQLLFRPLVAWADKFRYEQTAAAVVPRSWIIDLFRRTKMLRAAGDSIGAVTQAAARARVLGAVICSAARGAARSFPFARRPLVWNCPARRRLPRIGAAAICRGAIVMAGSVRRDRRWQHHFAARRRPHRHRDRHLGPGRSCRRLAPGLGGKGSAGGAVSRGISGKLVVSARGLSDRQVRSFTRDLVEPADDFLERSGTLYSMSSPAPAPFRRTSGRRRRRSGYGDGVGGAMSCSRESSRIT